MQVNILLFDHVEVLDFAGPYEVFSTASRVWSRSQQAPAPFTVSTVAEGTVVARGGLTVQPDYTLAQAPQADLLLVPGGDVRAQLDNRSVLDWLGEQASRADVVASVCTGAFLLGQLGILHGLPITTHWEDLDDLRQALPDSLVRDDLRWVDNGHILTSAGISAGIDMSLHLVARLSSRSLADATAKQMDYRWQDTPAHLAQV
ncbi:DJ-1/PfpI family protein [Atopomonas sediminilitoris]|uniref:DJ-1/PfpI family protein n=1 Tax=Atopomonas sediminilitoris TaxID=2919919 RepID=UPI001F4E26C8|nr:DJ-1/PfpI family protein [Atopomonas sediminilitoris]MCJ8169073.1 DJ-1/PfpI family protein [Atopomonas sediminilitoris]